MGNGIQISSFFSYNLIPHHLLLISGSPHQGPKSEPATEAPNPPCLHYSTATSACCQKATTQLQAQPGDAADGDGGGARHVPRVCQRQGRGARQFDGPAGGG